MSDGYLDEKEIKVKPSMSAEDLGQEDGQNFSIERPGMDQNMLGEVGNSEDSFKVDFKHLLELTKYSEKGSNQLGDLVQKWEYQQANAIRLLHEEIDILRKQRQEDEKLVIRQELETDVLDDTTKNWKQQAMQLDKISGARFQGEQALTEKLQENIKLLERQCSPIEELSHMLKRADNFLRFVLQNAPVVIGHQDIIGKTEVEIFTGSGVQESQDFKKEVMERRLPAMREITFETELFGAKTFVLYVEPVFSKAGDTMGVNYVGMQITNQVMKREKQMAMLREEIAVQKVKEAELNRTIHLTEEMLRAKQMLAHEIKFPSQGLSV